MGDSVKTYHIHEGYTPRLDNWAFDDTSFKDEWQLPVYQIARALLEQHHLKTVVDLGCGSGYKLVHLFPDVFTIGVELEPTLTWLTGVYPKHRWIPPEGLEGITADLVICSDVIEHLVDPDIILDQIEKLDPKWIVLSTPALERLQIGTDGGPPKNIHHVREWTSDEFRSYIGERFEIVSQSHTNEGTQILVAVLKREKPL